MKSLRILTLLGVTFALVGCFKEDYSFCPPIGPIVPEANVRLVITTDYEKSATRGAAGIGWYKDQIDAVSVLVFDENDNYVTSWEGGAYSLDKEYAVELNLPEGHTYHYVAWTNRTASEYDLSHWSDRLGAHLSHGDLTMRLNVPSDGVIRTDIPHRHHGELASAAVFDGGTTTDHEIVLSPHTYKVNFIVNGVSAANGAYEARVTDSNRQHNFDLSHVEGQKAYSHVRTLTSGGTRAASGVSASMRLLQIGDDTGTAFDITNKTTGETLYSGDLLDTIQDHYDLTDAQLTALLDNEYEYDITVTYTDLEVKVGVSIPGWKSDDIEDGGFYD